MKLGKIIRAAAGKVYRNRSTMKFLYSRSFKLEIVINNQLIIRNVLSGFTFRVRFLRESFRVFVECTLDVLLFLTVG